MTKQEYLAFVKETLDSMSELIANKNNDYTGGSSSPFANLELVEHVDVVSTEKAIFVRLSDKYSRLASFLSQGTLKVKDETIEDTCKDMIGYSLLMMGYLKHKKEKK